WAYIGFSQMMLIWYAALPEETTFFHHRWDEGPWKNFSLMLVFGNFVIPFFLLISRNTKRKLGALFIGAVWIFVTHIVDVYWLVMPNVLPRATFTFDVLDVLCLVGVGGVYLAVVLTLMRRHRLIP